MEKVHIIRIEEETHSKIGSLYRILSPDEILSGVFKLSIVNLNIVKMSISKKTISSLSIVNLNTVYTQIDYTQNEYSKQNGSESGSSTIPNLSIVNLTTNKNSSFKDNLKTTEEVFVVVSSSELFRNLPQDTIAELCDKFGPDIVKEKVRNLEEQYKGKVVNNPGGLLHDALRKDYTPPENISRKRKAQEKKKKDEAIQEEMNRQEELARQRISEAKGKLSKIERTELRKRALQEIKKGGYKKEFVTEHLIEATENKIFGMGLNETEGK